MTTTTTTTPLSTVIGVFSDYKQANTAIDELRTANFRYESIRLVEHGTGSFRDTLKGMFSGQSAVASNTSESLVNMGMPQYEAEYYQRELDADHVLLLMNADDRPEDAFKVMRQNGAFDINSRLRTTELSDTGEASAPDTFTEPVSSTTPPTNSSRKDALTNSSPARSEETVDPNAPADMVDYKASMGRMGLGTPVVDPNAPDDMTDSTAFTNTDTVDPASQSKATRNA
jgi:hypothetical protein